MYLNKREKQKKISDLVAISPLNSNYYLYILPAGQHNTVGVAVCNMYSMQKKHIKLREKW